jgi:hypothetical protein
MELLIAIGLYLLIEWLFPSDGEDEGKKDGEFFLIDTFIDPKDRGFDNFNSHDSGKGGDNASNKSEGSGSSFR